MSDQDLRLIRAITDSNGDIVSNSTYYRTYTASGLPDEEVTGKIFQHYGFRSNAPSGTERFHLQYGNNAVSVAENDFFRITPWAERQTAVYCLDTNANTNNTIGTALILTPVDKLRGNTDCCAIIQSLKNVLIYNGSTDSESFIELNSVGGNVILAAKKVVAVQTGATQANVYYLITENILDYFINHSHQAQGPASPTTGPGYTAQATVPNPSNPITKNLLYNGNCVTKTLQSDASGL